MSQFEWEREEGILTKTGRKVEKPRLYKVLLHNDDYTTMDFVVYILRTVFRHSSSEATRIMLHVHQAGVGVAGVFTYEIAEMKVTQVTQLARDNDFPLLCTLEEE